MINVDLQAILNQSSGTYFLYYDRSIVPDIVETTGLRILVGQSKRGPVNTITYHQNWDSFKLFYGDVDTSLMRKGAYFHLSAFAMLQTGLPIAAINLRTFDDTLDVTGKIEFSTDVAKTNAAISTVPYSSMFDTRGFWTLDVDNVSDDNNLDNYLSFVNVSDNKLSVFVRRTSSNDFQQTISDYYTNTLRKSVPEYLNPDDILGDTFVDVYVFRNDFSDLVANQSNPSYGSLFDSEGVVKTTVNTLGQTVDGLEVLSGLESSGFAQVYTGSLIPDLVDISNNTLFIGNLINLDYTTIGLLAGVNEDILDDAANWEPTLDVNDNVVYANNGGKKDLPIDIIGHGLFDLNAAEELDEAAYNAQSVQTVSYEYTTNLATWDQDQPTTPDLTNVTLLKFENAKLGGNHVYNATTDQWTLNAVTTKAIVTSLQDCRVGDKFVGRSGNLVTVTRSNFLGTKRSLVDLHTSALPIYTDNTVFPTDSTGAYVYPVGDPNAGALVEFDAVTDAPLDAPGGTAIPFPTLSPAEEATILASNGTDLNIFELSFDKEVLHQNGALTEGPDTQANLPQGFLTLDDSTVVQTYNDGTGVLYKVITSEQFVDSYKPFALKSYRVRQDQFVNGTPSRQNEILNLLTGDLQSAISDTERLDFRYMVDSFNTYIEPNAKQQFTAAVRNRGVGAAILNSPKIKDLSNSTDPYFRETLTSNQFAARFLESGGNLNLPNTQQFTVGGFGNDKGYMYSPWFYFDLNGSEVFLPPAAAVSNNYAQKLNTGRPFDPVFGPDTGTISVNGIKRLEYDLTDEERKYFERIGINPIIFKKNSGNIVIGNRTMFTSANSALKFANVNEMITFLFEQMRPIAEFLLGKFNNDQNRLTAQKRMDAITNALLASGVLQFAENIVNTDNNTQEIISEGMAVMDTVIVPAFVADRVVHRLIINRTTEEITSTIL